MSAIASNTIVITAYPGKHGTINMSRSAEYSLLDTVDFDSDDSNSSGAGGPKKRRRLTHLSPDEKLLRRKLKNRVAAQTARDRKKALMVELEEKVAKLEEENKLLKKQNCTLKETSSSLAKENAALKSRLSDTPVPSIKTETDTYSTCCSSAEGTGTDSVSVDGLHFGDNSQPDDIFCLLQELSENGECEQSQEKAITPISESVSGGIITDSSNGTNNRIPTPRMVGLSSAELESLNELIQIDHVYVKPQPLIQIGGKEGQHKYTAAVLKQANNGSIVPTLNKPVALLGLKRNHTGDVVDSVPQPAEPITVSITGPSPLDFGRINANTTTVVAPSSVSNETLNLEESEFINTLSDSDMETSLNFFQDFNIDLIQSNCDTEVNKSSNIPNSFFNLLQNTQLEDLTTEKDLNATKLFDEIYEHYLSIKDSSLNSPDSHSDSGISSDIDPLSPQSSEGEFINDQLMWQDTSFADLFPDLQ